MAPLFELPVVPSCTLTGAVICVCLTAAMIWMWLQWTWRIQPWWSRCMNCSTALPTTTACPRRWVFGGPRGLSEHVPNMASFWRPLHFVGTLPPPRLPHSVPQQSHVYSSCLQERRAPAGVALRARLLSLFCRSVAAANCFPHSLTVGGLGSTSLLCAAAVRCDKGASAA